MKVGIMQPYFFPYIGYWQLINTVDQFVIYDDVNYIKSGWINRNRILVNGSDKLINISLNKASSNKLIKEIELQDNRVNAKKLLKTIEQSYKRAPYSSEVVPIIEEVIMQSQTNLAKYLEYSIRLVCDYLNVDTEIIVSSHLDKYNHFRGQDKVIEICKVLSANEYINAIGGQELYSYEDFNSKGLSLKFLKTKRIEYEQFENQFIPNLSIIDIMMFNSREKTSNLLNEYELL